MVKKKNLKTIVVIDIETGRLIAKELENPYIDYALILKAKKGANLIDEVEKIEGSSMVLDIDPLDPEALEGASLLVEKNLAPIELWINPPFQENIIIDSNSSYDKYKRKTDESFKVQLYGALSALRRMVPRNKGKILFICKETIPVINAYNDSKKAIEAFYKLIQMELKQENTCIDLHYIITPLTITSRIELFNNVPEKKFLLKSRYDTARLAVHGINYLLKGN